MSNIEINVLSKAVVFLEAKDLIYNTAYWTNTLNPGKKEYYILVNTAGGDAIVNLYNSFESVLVKNVGPLAKFCQCNRVTISIEE